MSDDLQQHAASLQNHFDDKLLKTIVAYEEITIDVAPQHLIEVSSELRDNANFNYQQLTDLCGVDYSQFGQTEWETEEATSCGFSRGVEPATMGRMSFGDEIETSTAEQPRFASVMHLLSIANNRRLRVRCFADNDDFPMLPSVTDLWASANWYEREAFDLFGIMYSDHPDLRRILTDYGFIGHPFRKDFPLVGHVEMRYDPEQQRVIYQPVSIEPRVLVPRVKREDNRYLAPDDVQEDAE